MLHKAIGSYETCCICITINSRPYYYRQHILFDTANNANGANAATVD